MDQTIQYKAATMRFATGEHCVVCPFCELVVRVRIAGEKEFPRIGRRVETCEHLVDSVMYNETGPRLFSLGFKE